MKKSLSLLLAGISLITVAQAQGLSVSPDLYDSVAVNSYHFHFTGTVSFSDEMKAYYLATPEIKDDIYINVYNFETTIEDEQ